jgi:hypothetical protein
MAMDVTRRQEDDDLHGGVFELVDAEPPQMIGEMDHALDARAEAQGAGLLQGDGFTVRNSYLARSGHRAEATGKQQQLAPRVDQQRNLIVNLSNRTTNLKTKFFI